MRACRPKSSLLQRVDYDDGADLLTVTLPGQRIYQYAAVPLDLFRELCRATSPGQFYNRHVKGRFACREVTPRRRYPLD
jgi:hypothetical protein